MDGRVTKVSSPPTSRSPSEVCSTPPVIVVEPLTPLSDAVQVLLRLVAVNTSAPELFTFWMSVELAAEPPTSSDPSVFAVIGPEENIVAGPKTAAPVPTLAVWGLFEASAASVTLGVGAIGGWAPPKIVSFGTEYPEALPVIGLVPPATVVVVVVPPATVVVVGGLPFLPLAPTL